MIHDAVYDWVYGRRQVDKNNTDPRILWRQNFHCFGKNHANCQCWYPTENKPEHDNKQYFSGSEFFAIRSRALFTSLQGAGHSERVSADYSINQEIAQQH